MPSEFLITSPQNPRIKLAIRLRDRRDRDREQRFIIEGYRELRRATDNGYPIHELFVCPELFLGENEPALIEACRQRGATVIETSAPVFQRMAYRERPEGLLAIAPMLHRTLAELTLGSNPLLLVAVAIEKPGNLGTILRSADATGVSALIICDQCTDLFNPNVVRASTGTLFTLPIAETTTAELLPWLQQQGVRTLAATPHTDTLFTAVEMTGPVAVVVGCEMIGLSDAWLDRADLKVRIPMLGKADSLNVATATTLLLYEAVRQRQAAAAPTPR